MFMLMLMFYAGCNSLKLKERRGWAGGGIAKQSDRQGDQGMAEDEVEDEVGSRDKMLSSCSCYLLTTLLLLTGLSLVELCL
ncbi:hypothetical protein TRV_03688 [Trichophyton verrucosum HKI 0517]|uniref:Uncharacterized protein n=1 Tax=Trichophyton verrucosum (strain HKI 0517) TaxID=663202 RepID=D4D997_TRIVH|nr:uncharacterized protein TRV_03688 [Trichophyton verrucosum HKI 0517]EFE41589.1 hypothetical protein TRV_03688 [Trichophyton verrucosum HKI 0517]